MEQVTTIGIDIAKRIFQIHGVDKNGKIVLKKKLTRDKLSEFMATLPKCLVGMEACGGAHHWARKFTNLGHEVKLMAPQFVKPYVKTNKNDEADAEAICEAVARPNMRFVGIKTIEQQDILSIHAVRSRLIKNRTALGNEIRGLLSEFGVIIPQGINNVRKHLTVILDGDTLSGISRQTFQDLKEELKELDKRIDALELRLKEIAGNNVKHKQLMNIPGIGLIISTALIAGIGNASAFKNGRQLSAWLGLVPRQNSSGGKEILLGISKRGNVYLRTLLIQGAKSLLRSRITALSKAGVSEFVNEETGEVTYITENKSNKLNSKFTQWMLNLSESKGSNRTAVAVANKLARVVYSVLSTDTVYTESKVCY